MFAATSVLPVLDEAVVESVVEAVVMVVSVVTVASEAAEVFTALVLVVLDLSSPSSSDSALFSTSNCSDWAKMPVFPAALLWKLNWYPSSWGTPFSVTTMLPLERLTSPRSLLNGVCPAAMLTRKRWARDGSVLTVDQETVIPEDGSTRSPLAGEVIWMARAQHATRSVVGRKNKRILTVQVLA